MKCPHCDTKIHFEASGSSYYFDYSDEEKERNPGCDGFYLEHGNCLECGKLIVMFRVGSFRDGRAGGFEWETKRRDILYPKSTLRPVAPEVRQHYCRDFGEAVGVLDISPKASAALSRRLLQHLLRDELGIKRSRLSQEIEEFISRTEVPSLLSGAIDAVRQVGNFAAHPLKDTNTGEIIDVEPGEADWLLDVLEELFDFVFVKPTRLAAKQDQLNAKLLAAGKPRMKGT